MVTLPRITSVIPRIGEKRELKKATEAYWRGEISVAELEEVGRTAAQGALAGAKGGRH